MNRLDYVILGILNSENAKSLPTGITVNEMVELQPISKGITFYKRLQLLIKDGYVLKGVLASRADTYFITDKGIEIIKSETN